MREPIADDDAIERVDLAVAVLILVLQIARRRLRVLLRPGRDFLRCLEDADRLDAEDRVDRIADAADARGRRTVARVDLVAARQARDAVLVVRDVEPDRVVERTDVAAPVERRLPPGVLHGAGVLRRRRVADERGDRHGDQDARRALVVEVTRERELAVEQLDVHTAVRLLGGLPPDVGVRDAARRGATGEHVVVDVVPRIDVDGLLEQVVADAVVAEAAPRAAQLQVVDRTEVVPQQRLVRHAPRERRGREVAVLLVRAESRRAVVAEVELGEIPVVPRVVQAGELAHET